MYLAEALDEALSRYYTVPTGLLGQLLTILRHTPEGQAGRPADALGVSAGTWNAWLLGARGQAGGRRPNAANAERIREVARRARAGAQTVPTRATVCAYIVWSGYINRRPYRCVNLDGLVLVAMVQAWRDGAGINEVAELFTLAVDDRYGAQVEFMDAEEFAAWGGEAQVEGVTVELKP
jgi:hypothetical protein